jgi:ATP-dependent Clp protease adaptor protein ClpS
MTQSNPSVAVATVTKTNVKPPQMFDVVFFNDNKTYYEFVVLVLMQLFGKDYDSAVSLTEQIHKKGRAPVATYTHEIACAKRDETVATARANGHPLRVEVQPSGDQ